ncbi:MAG TPA: alpha/beta hydrolase [Pseudomonadales bacterium]
MGAWQEGRIAVGTRQIAFRIHGPDEGTPVLAIHGWRDNAATFELLGPLLPGLRIIAIDLPGHGLSSWRDADGDYYIWSYLKDVLAVADSLQLARFDLLGHSMGGAVSALLAGLLPGRVGRLAMLDAAGPLATAPNEAPEQLARALEQARLPMRRNHYVSFEAAVAARAAKGLQLPAATILGRRGIAQDDKGWYWTLDPRLSRANQMSMTEEQAEAFLRRIACPSLLVSAPSWWAEHGKQDWFEQRCTYFGTLQRVALRGGHHQHLEEYVDDVAALLRDFFDPRDA